MMFLFFLILVEEEQVFLLTLPFGIFGWFYLFLSAAFGCPVDWQLAGLLWFFHLVARYELSIGGFFRRQFMLTFPNRFLFELVFGSGCYRKLYGELLLY